MRRALILLFAAGCGGTIETTTQPLEVAPIDGLPAYDGGRVLHPWHSSKPARERFAQVPIAASASDADCLLGDERFDKCLVFDCEKNPCPTGTCWDVTVMHDPDGSPPPVIDWHGIPIVYLPDGSYYQPLHQATCLK
jgi:hypothetical protein